MYIGIDGNEANIKMRVGVNQYAYELLCGLYRLNEGQKVKDNYIIYLKHKPLSDLPKESEHWKYSVLPGKGMWVLTTLQKELVLEKRLDVFFTPSHYLPLITRCPKVCAIHDLGYLNFSGQFKKFDFWQLKYWTAISLYISKYIITFSQFTKNDIVRHYPSVSKKPYVVYHGFRADLYNTKISEDVVRRMKKKHKIDGEYILFLGTLKPSKNIESLVAAYAVLKKSHPNYRLVIAGKKGWLYESIFKKTQELGLKDDVTFTDFIEDADKPALIRGAKVFTIPSYWEGFGMDIITSYACGVPVVGSDVASISEIGGDVLIKCNPDSIESIAASIEKVLKMNPKEYNILSQRCVRRSKMFSWDKSARQTLEVLKKAAI